jgi:DNA topoisomerase-1
MSKLIIVESPGKIKKIKSFLGSEYNVMASIGHIRDLAKGSISVDPLNNFKPTYEIMCDKKQVVIGLKKAAKSSSEVYIASDGDREGEAIAQHLVEVLKLTSYKRIVFNEITKGAINKALQMPTQVDQNMFNSQQARRILDRLVGYKLSPILKSIPNIESNSLGAGRVQSVVTRIIVDREKEIEDFLSDSKSSSYNINGDFEINKTKFKATLLNYNLINDQIIISESKPHIKSDIINSWKLSKGPIESIDNVKYIIWCIDSNPIFQIESVKINDRQRHPPQPFITSTLQQEASYKLKFQLKQTMSYAQKLYEKGLITYMRTDSPALSNEALGLIKKQIMDDPALGESYYQFKQFKAKGSNAQEAHEAIRPTYFNVFDLTNYDLAQSNEEKLYQLIWNRTVASQLKPAKYQDQYIILNNQNPNPIRFEGTNSVLVFDGYLKLYMENNDTENEDQVSNTHIKINDQNLKSNIVDWSKINIKETYNSPPPRYNEPSLVKKLEGLGVGRPSTYAAIISKIQEHKYIKIGNVQGIDKNISTHTLFNLNLNSKSNPKSKSNSKTKSNSKLSNLRLESKATKQKIGGEKLKLIPTSDGIIITNYLTNNFPQIMDLKFTAHMETQLDEIAEGTKIWYKVLDEFYNILKKQFIKLGLNLNEYSKLSNSSNLVSNDSKFNSDSGDSNDSDESDEFDEFDDLDDQDILSKSSKLKISNKILDQPPKTLNQQIIGSHPKYGDIIFMEAKYGPTFKIKFNSKSKSNLSKDLFVSAGRLKPSTPNIIENAIKLIDYKIKKLLLD